MLVPSNSHCILPITTFDLSEFGFLSLNRYFCWLEKQLFHIIYILVIQKSPYQPIKLHFTVRHYSLHMPAVPNLMDHRFCTQDQALRSRRRIDQMNRSDISSQLEAIGERRHIDQSTLNSLHPPPPPLSPSKSRYQATQTYAKHHIWEVDSLLILFTPTDTGLPQD